MVNVIKVKAGLLENPFIKVSSKIRSFDLFSASVTKENLYNSEHIFVNLDGRVKVRLGVGENAEVSLIPLDLEEKNRFQIIDSNSGELLIAPVEIIFLQDPLLHSPGQALFNLFKSCSRNCLYCPLPLNKEKECFVYETKFMQMIENIDPLAVNRIGFTSGIPGEWSYDRLIEEMVKIVRALRRCHGDGLTISAAPPPVSRELIQKLHDAGLSEIRINIEVYNRQLFAKLCPKFDFDETFISIANAVNIFGRNRVSTNMVLGLGESDEDVFKGIEEFARMGVITTLSPLDVVPERIDGLQRLTGNRAGRPNRERLYNLAMKHKEIFMDYEVNPTLKLRTMCSVCAACNIMPFVDF